MERNARWEADLGTACVRGARQCAVWRWDDVGRDARIRQGRHEVARDVDGSMTRRGRSTTQRGPRRQEEGRRGQLGVVGCAG